MEPTWSPLTKPAARAIAAAATPMLAVKISRSKPHQGRANRGGSMKTWTQHKARADALPGFSARADTSRSSDQAATSKPTATMNQPIVTA